MADHSTTPSERARFPWFRVTAIAAATAVVWFIAANAIWSPDDPPFWAWLAFLALFFTVLASLLIGLVSKFVLRT